MDFTSLRNTIKTKNDLLEVIELVRKYRLHIMLTKGQLICEMYRGQGRNNWKLEPNIVRNIRNVAEIKNVEKQIINEFHETLVKNNISKHLQTGFLNGKFHSEWLLIEQAQHYGIPTRFMDWTINWEVALFFAVSNPNDDIFDADFWIYIVQPEQREVDNHESIYYNFNPLEYEETKFLNAAGYLSDD